jgi:D-alanine transaminase
MSLVYLNRELLPLDQAQISVLDRGFLFGDGVYEVIPVYNGRLFRLQQHLDRLERSLAGIRVRSPHSHDEWKNIIESVVEQQHVPDQSVYVQVTRGVAKRRDHAFDDSLTPTVFVMTNALAVVDRNDIALGVSAVTRDDIRWDRCNIKAITLLANVLMKQEASDEGAAEAILIRDGLAVEGSASNLFAVIDGTITTPPTGSNLLPGITRDLVLELAQLHGLAHAEQDIPRAQLEQADELWLTSSTREILPIIELDGHPVSDAKAGPVWGTMIDLYQAYKRTL